MLPFYVTVRRYGAEEIIIKKSRFIGQAAPAQQEEEAHRFIAEARKRNSAASHHAYAYVIGDRNEVERQSDDGEPGGTAGKPILDVILKRNLQNIVVVVSRYFGGIKRGAGGLIRSYSTGASLGIEAAQPIRKVLHQEILVEIDYSWFAKLENELKNNEVLRGETVFTDKVLLSCFPVHGAREDFIRRMIDLTEGQSKITTGKVKYIAVDEI